MTPLAAHATCTLLVITDFVVRALRIKWLTKGVGYRLSFRDAFSVNALGDAASAVSPLRIAGEPARLGAMLRAGVPATAAFVTITYEVLAAWPVILLSAGILAWRYAPAWWSSVAPEMSKAAREAWPWIVFVAVVTVGLWVWLRRAVPSVAHHVRRPLRRMLVHWRRMPWGPLLASTPLSFVNLATRVAILPVLASTLPSPPPLGSMLIGSFALLYSQLILPTPSGIGAVELGFMGGAAGNMGDQQGGILLLWRLYTTGIGVVVGLILGVRIFGWQAIRNLIRPPRPESN
ncbi:MAG: lysylphosphatidylglycerol synthase transmembrane domain-containing protein [Gemmatimonadota bacterium]